jgi:hypothetical protein
MDDAFAKEYLHNDLRDVRAVMLWKLDGLSEYDIRRPLTATGTNLLGLVKHLSHTEARYFGDIFNRPFPERLPWWDEGAQFDADLWVTPDETRTEIVDRYRAACAHADITIGALDLDTPGHVPWWPLPNVTLFNVIVHVLTETNRHAGHADILREQIDDAVGTNPESAARYDQGTAFWAAHRAKIEHAALAARSAKNNLDNDPGALSPNVQD